MKIVMVAGGTGGHIYPALHLADSLKDKNEITFFGSDKRLENELIPAAGYNFIALETIAFSGSLMRRINSLLLMRDSYHIAKSELKKFNADVVIGFGNYISVPVVLAAKSLNIKTLIHEQNCKIGAANRYLAKKADFCVCCYKESLEKLPKAKSLCLGNPRSSMFKDVKRNRSILKEYGLDPSIATVVIFMGSLGSISINEFMLQALKEIRKEDFQVIYITGKEYYQEFITKFNETDNVKIKDYANMVELLPNIDLLVARAGATTIAEITALGLPTIFIPSPYVPNNHQYFNAKNLVDYKAAMLINEEDLDIDKFNDILKTTISDKEKLSEMASKTKEFANVNCCEDIIKLIEKVV